MEVDKEVFKKLAEQTRAGLDVNLDGTYVLSALMESATVDQKINLLIAPRQRPAGGQDRYTQPQRGSRQVEPAKQASGKGQGSKGKSGKGKRAKGKGKNVTRDYMPKELADKGNMTATHNGKRICFGYNLQGCSEEVNHLGECSKGLHVCSRKDCGGNHPQHYDKCPRLHKRKSM